MSAICYGACLPKSRISLKPHQHWWQQDIRRLEVLLWSGCRIWDPSPVMNHNHLTAKFAVAAYRLHRPVWSLASSPGFGVPIFLLWVKGPFCFYRCHRSYPARPGSSSRKRDRARSTRKMRWIQNGETVVRSAGSSSEPVPHSIRSCCGFRIYGST